MFDKAKDLGCSNGDIPCLCKNSDFGNGLRDCTNEACPEGQLEAVESAAARICRGCKQLSRFLNTQCDNANAHSLQPVVAHLPPAPVLRVTGSPPRPHP